MSDNQDVTSEMMEFQSFDNTVKKALENIEVPYDASTWDALSSKLDALAAPDAVDKVVKPVLDRVEMPYDAGSWAALANKMDYIARVRRIRMTKLAEAAIFLLLLLNLEGFFGVVESVTRPKIHPAKANLPVVDAQPFQSPKFTKATQNPTINIVPQNNEASLSDQLASIVKSITENWGIEVLPDAQTSENLFVENARDLNPALFYTEAGLLQKTPETILALNAFQPVWLTKKAVEIPGLKLPFSNRPKSAYYATTFVRFDHNKILDQDSRDETNNLGGGFAIGYRKGKWGIESGLAFAQKSYRPKRETIEYFNNPFQGIGLYYVNEVSADVVTIPVKVTRKVAKVASVSAHAVAGVSAQVATQKNYAYQSLYYPPPIPQIDPNPSDPTLIEFPEGKGLFETGGASHNVYTTVDLGLRFEQTLGKRYVAFVEPLYSASLGGGFGPKTARINTFSLQAGILATL